MNKVYFYITILLMTTLTITSICYKAWIPTILFGSITMLLRFVYLPKLSKL